MTFRKTFKSIVITSVLLSPLCAGEVKVKNDTPRTINVTIRGIENKSGKSPVTLTREVDPGKDITITLDEKEFNGTTFSIQGTTVVTAPGVVTSNEAGGPVVVAPSAVALTSNEDVVSGSLAKLVFVTKTDGSALVCVVTRVDA